MGERFQGAVWRRRRSRPRASTGRLHALRRARDADPTRAAGSRACASSTVRHEQSAAHAAEAWGRVRRSCGVAVVTAGPGVTGTVTAVANAIRAGAAPRDRRSAAARAGGARRAAGVRPALPDEADHEVGRRVRDDRADPRVRRDRVPPRARDTARARVPRAADGRPLRRGRRRPGRRRPRDPTRGRRAIPPRSSARGSLLSEAERPAIVAGSGVWWDGAADALDALARHGDGAGVPQRRRARLASTRSSVPVPARAPGRPGPRPTSCASSARRSTSGSATGRSARRRSCTCTATRASSDATAYPRWRSRATAASSLETLWPLVRPQSDRAAWLESLRAAESRLVGRAPARDRVRQRAAQPLPPRRRARPHPRAGHRRDRRRRRRRRGRLARPPRASARATGSTPARSAASASARATRSVWAPPGFGDAIVVVMGDGAFGLNGLDYDTLVRFDVPAVLVSATTPPGARSGSRRSASTAPRARSRRALAPEPLRLDLRDLRRPRRARRAARRAAARARACARRRRAGDRERHARPRRDGRARLPRHVSGSWPTYKGRLRQHETWPGEMAAPRRWFRCSIFQTPARGSPA